MVKNANITPIITITTAPTVPPTGTAKSSDEEEESVIACIVSGGNYIFNLNIVT